MKYQALALLILSSSMPALSLAQVHEQSFSAPLDYFHAHHINGTPAPEFDQQCVLKYPAGKRGNFVKFDDFQDYTYAVTYHHGTIPAYQIIHNRYEFMTHGAGALSSEGVQRIFFKVNDANKAIAHVMFAGGNDFNCVLSTRDS